MAHKIHTTSAFIIAERPSGEANKLLTLFTRELGLLHASARSVREVRSKLRYNLSLYSRSRVSLVQGREYWIITGAEESSGDISPTMATLLLRFLGAHEPQVEIFDEIVSGRRPERELTLKILDILGYVGREPSSERETEEFIERAVYASHL
ncbi:MAG TPA: recombination protein O N-terminal domain-containing protein [Candidatus Paceibacterota bacterium]